jgi:hypothetical protein
VAPVLLALVALFQIALSSQTPLSVWKGGGFGMYSNVDNLGARWLRATLITARGEVAVSFVRATEGRPLLAQRGKNLRSLPYSQGLDALARDFATTRGVWADCSPPRRKRAGPPSGRLVSIMSVARQREQGCRAMEVEGARLEIWRYRYESLGSRVVAEKLAGGGTVRP